MVFRVSLASCWLLVIGLACTYLELSQVRTGHRIHGALEDLDRLKDRIRTLEIRYSRLVGADALEAKLEDFLKETPTDSPAEIRDVGL